MQEHEYGHEHELEQNREHEVAQGPELIDDLLGPDLELIDGEIIGEKFSESSEVEEMRDQRATLRLGRVLVVGLGLSFLACLAALWLSSTLLSAPLQVLPAAFLQLLAANRVLVLCAPAVCLVICFLALRSLTGEIMAVPEYKLDERQKMLRDQAHRSAFKIIKFSSVLIPVAFVLPHLPWFDSSPPTAVPPVGIPARIFAYSADGSQSVFMRLQGFQRWHRGDNPFGGPGGPPVQAVPLIQSASAPEIVLAGGLLLLCLLVMLSALPMAVLAWKGKA